ncbi:MAG: hypothetical protein ABI467_33090 [Kofleriaceae bacterium]
MTRLVAAFAALALAAPSALAADHKDSLINIDHDRVHALDASAVVQAQERFVRLQEHRVVALEHLWSDAIKADAPNEAGRFAQEHWKALQIELRARVALRHARHDFSAARERLISDEYAVQQQG